ncbi:hypothetical protein F4778DRAFT_279758 [Xylariomycetidae sp. FL2044]|nr:hypothetical protein F4778DRAFT_279758 [Xylariomycetidae sp. FL2044]
MAGGYVGGTQMSRSLSDSTLHDINSFQPIHAFEKKKRRLSQSHYLRTLDGMVIPTHTKRARLVEDSKGFAMAKLEQDTIPSFFVLQESTTSTSSLEDMFMWPENSSCIPHDTVGLSPCLRRSNTVDYRTEVEQRYVRRIPTPSFYILKEASKSSSVEKGPPRPPRLRHAHSRVHTQPLGREAKAGYPLKTRDVASAISYHHPAMNWDPYHERAADLVERDLRDHQRLRRLSHHARILKGLINSRHLGWGPSDIIDEASQQGIFSAANEIFFHGKLRNRVSWQWEELPSGFIGMMALRRRLSGEEGQGLLRVPTPAPTLASARPSSRTRTITTATTTMSLPTMSGYCDDDSHQTPNNKNTNEQDIFDPLILLSAKVLKDRRYDRRLFISTFLHELIHCYLFVECGLHAGRCGGHTNGFERIASMIDEWAGGPDVLRLHNVEAELSDFETGGHEEGTREFGSGRLGTLGPRMSTCHHNNTCSFGSGYYGYAYGGVSGTSGDDLKSPPPTSFATTTTISSPTGPRTPPLPISYEMIATTTSTETRKVPPPPPRTRNELEGIYRYGHFYIPDTRPRPAATTRIMIEGLA